MRCRGSLDELEQELLGSASLAGLTFPASEVPLMLEQGRQVGDSAILGRCLFRQGKAGQVGNSPTIAAILAGSFSLRGRGLEVLLG